MTHLADTATAGAGIVILGFVTGLDPQYMFAALIGSLFGQLYVEQMVLWLRVFTILCSVGVGAYTAPFVIVFFFDSYIQNADSQGVAGRFAALTAGFLAYKVIGPRLIQVGNAWIAKRTPK